MAPSRGRLLFKPSLTLCRAKVPGRLIFLDSTCQRDYVSPSFQEVVANPLNRHQVYISRSLNPYLNLSIEHYLLQKSSPASTVLFLYTNRPCVVIGRNQNPWSEVNLPLLRGLQSKDQGRAQSLQNVSLVRRRSGGGTVFHDEGNVNYSVICPPAEFDRDRHAKMVVRALNTLGAGRVRVNERHDVVLDGSSPKESGSSLQKNTDSPGPLKVSGSAYKITRLRALHHGTCLLSSPNLSSISSLLRSPARPYIKARGVESVRSPVANLNIDNTAFERAVLSEFISLYRINSLDLDMGRESAIQEGEHWAGGIVNDECLSVEAISKGTDELMSPEWIYAQTPQFELSNQYHEGLNEESGPGNSIMSKKISLHLTIRYGAVLSSKILKSTSPGWEETLDTINQRLVSQKVHEIKDWNRVLDKIPHGDNALRGQIGDWLNSMLGTDN